MLIIAAMIPWYAAFNMRQWAKRVLCFRNLLLVLLAFLGIAAELYFGWMEAVLGAYLSAANEQRPEVGTVWLWNRKTVAAMQKLDKLLDQPVLEQGGDNPNGAMARILKQAAGKGGVMLSAGRFVRVYLSLPPQIAEEIVSPFDLLQLQSADQWKRTFIEGRPGHLNIYYLDGRNSVMAQSSIGPELLEYLDKGQALVQGSLESLADFRAFMIPAASFFKALAGMPNKLGRRIIARPDALLVLGGRIKRVGISDQRIDNGVTLGFEIQIDGQLQVMLVQADSRAVEDLKLVLAAQGYPDQGAGGRRWRHGE